MAEGVERAEDGVGGSEGIAPGGTDMVGDVVDGVEDEAAYFFREHGGEVLA